MLRGTEQMPARRTATMLKVGAVLVVFAAMWAVAVVAFNLGAAQGAVTIAVAAVIYLVPATIFDWPRITLTDIAEFVWAAITGFFSFLRTLFDW